MDTLYQSSKSESSKTSSEDADDDETRELSENLVRLQTENLESNTRKVKTQNRITRLERLTQEMKLLQWHKLANSAALKAALIRNKRLKNDIRKKRGSESIIKGASRHARLDEIIIKEKSLLANRNKPAEYNIAVENWNDVKQRQLKLLTHVKKKLRKSEEIRIRNQQYRERKVQINKLKKLGLNPNSRLDAHLSATEKLLSTSNSISNIDLDFENEAKYRRFLGLSPRLKTLSKSQTLETVNQLIELEKRIKSLKNDFAQSSAKKSKKKLKSKSNPKNISSIALNLREDYEFQLPKKYMDIKTVYKKGESDMIPVSSSSINNSSPRGRIKFFEDKLQQQESLFLSQHPPLNT